MSNNNNISAVRLGDKIIVFSNGERQVVSKSMSPEIFETLSGYIQNNELDKISNIFNNFESKLETYLQDYFTLDEGKLKDIFHNEKHHFSNILIRKATEMMSLNASVEPLYNFSKKLFFASSGIEVKADTLFTKLSTMHITKEGNLLLPVTSRNNKSAGKVQGEPIGVNKSNENNELIRKNRQTPLSLCVTKTEFTHFALINPFDIVGFTNSDIIISRYKLYSKEEIGNEKGTINIPKEKLFDISYDIFEKEYKKTQ